MSEVHAYPLSWPEGWKRTEPAKRRRAQFHKTTRQYSSAPGGGTWLSKANISVADAVARIRDELRRMRILDDNVVISTNLRVRLDGLPRSDQAQPQDPGAAPMTASKPWRDVLGVHHPDPTQESITVAYRIARSKAHPDKGGTDAEFQAVDRAYEQAQREIGFTP